jgi:hypothetical protein
VENSKLLLSIPLHVVGLKSGFLAYTMKKHQRCLRKGARGEALAGGWEGQGLRSFMTCGEGKNFENAEIKRNETSGISRNGRDY